LAVNISVMTFPEPDPSSRNIQAELARERNRAAAERTLMAWIRTSLSLIAFGFGIDQIVATLQRLYQGAVISSVQLSRVLGMAYILLGIYAMVVATIEHYQELRRIQRQEDYIYRPRRSLGLTVAIAMIAIGIFAFVGILVKSLLR